MPLFIYKVKDERGRAYLGVSEADDAKTLKQSLREHGWYALKMRPFKKSRKSFFFKKRVDLDVLIMFTHQLASMLDAGIPILTGLDIMWKQIDDPTFQIVISQIRNRLSQGGSLSEAFNEFPDIFPPLYRSLLGVAEPSGNLVKILRKLLEHLNNQKEFIGKIKKATTYPLIVICFAIFVVSLMLLWVVPIFTSVFIKLKIELPLFTKLVIKTSSVMNSAWFWLFSGCVFSVIFIAYKKFNSTSFGQEMVDSVKLKLPILGRVMYDASISQFSHSLSLLLGSGLSITKSMEVAKRAAVNTKIIKVLGWVEDKIIEGSPLGISLDETRLFPSFLIEMITIGEETGTLVDMLDRIALHFEEDLDLRLHRLLTILEPLLIIVVGGLVVFILMAIYLPIFKLWGGIAAIK